MIDDPLNRLKVKRGTSLPQAKLNEKLVARIRAEYSASRDIIQYLTQGYSAKSLAKKYGVHERTMENVLRGETWSHVT